MCSGLQPSSRGVPTPRPVLLQHLIHQNLLYYPVQFRLDVQLYKLDLGVRDRQPRVICLGEYAPTLWSRYYDIGALDAYTSCCVDISFAFRLGN